MYTILYQCVQRIYHGSERVIDNVQSDVAASLTAASHFRDEDPGVASGDEECLARRRFSLLEDPQRRDLWTLWDRGESTDAASLLIVIGFMSGSSESPFVRESRLGDRALEGAAEAIFIGFLASSVQLPAAFSAVSAVVC